MGEVWAPTPAHTKLQPYPGSYKETRQGCVGDCIGSVCMLAIGNPAGNFLAADVLLDFFFRHRGNTCPWIVCGALGGHERRGGGEWLCHGSERVSPLGVDFHSLASDGTLPRGSLTVCKVATRCGCSHLHPFHQSCCSVAKCRRPCQASGIFHHRLLWFQSRKTGNATSSAG